MGDFWGQNGIRVIQCLPPKIVFTFGTIFFTSVANIGENPSRNASMRVHTDGHTERGKLVL